ncbi:MAG: enoyl-CoA hydratase-related protein [Nitratireductor sp.]
MKDLQHHRVEIKDFIATVTVNRPPVNAQNRALREEGTAIFDMLGDRDDVRVIILTAAGRYFFGGRRHQGKTELFARAGILHKPQ